MTTENQQMLAAMQQIHDDYHGKIANIDTRMQAKENEVDQFLANAQPESRYVQDIHIGGSVDKLYPVWWTMPGNEQGVSKITIARHYSWDGGVDERPLNPNGVHQAALLLELEGNASPWSGDADFLEVKRIHERYAHTAAHVSFSMYCKAEKIDATKDLYGAAGPDNICSTASGLYLRGGGLGYRIIKNWAGDVNFHDGTDSDRRVISEHTASNWTVRWFAEPVNVADTTFIPEKLTIY